MITFKLLHTKPTELVLAHRALHMIAANISYDSDSTLRTTDYVILVHVLFQLLCVFDKTRLTRMNQVIALEADIDLAHVAGSVGSVVHLLEYCIAHLVDADFLAPLDCQAGISDSLVPNF